ncbi:MAG TPA: hypothetical protein VKB51_09780 [bacterium]|nr:hypothetical protein [bacterium]
MSEDKQLQEEALDPAEAGDADAFTAEFGDTGDETSEDVTELPQEIQVKQGNCPDLELEKLRPICTLAEQNYQSVQEHIKALRKANDVLRKFHARDPNVAPKDVDQAKQEFHEAKQAYLVLGNKINEGIKQVYVHAKTYPEDLLVQNLYATYLAKLLASLETRNHVEPYVQRLADYVFVFDREDIVLTAEEERRDMTIQMKKAEVLGAAEKSVARLEARYQKRQLQNRLRQEERPGRVINQLLRISRQDPEDIHTFIWLANLLTTELPRTRDQNKRLEVRDDILSYCTRAFGMIDDFLNLQGIQNLSERDKRRAEYVKTITQIRKPLLQGESHS